MKNSSKYLKHAGLAEGRPLARRAAGPFLLSLAFFLALALSAYAEQEQEKENVNPHGAGAEKHCLVCHKGEPPFLSFDPVTTCVRCHPGNVGNHPVTRHPIGKMPRINIPAVLPLTEEGQMVCYTCHDPHKKTRHLKMLRVEFHKLCAMCHVGY